MKKEIHSGDVERDHSPWVIFYNSGDGTTPSNNELLRLAIDVQGLANVAIVDCQNSKLFCQLQQIENDSVRFYERNRLKWNALSEWVS